MKKLVAEGGNLTAEESKSALGGVSIAGVRQKFEESGMEIMAPVTVENCNPPSYVAYRTKAHEHGS